jgi:hypothetical protein
MRSEKLMGDITEVAKIDGTGEATVEVGAGGELGLGREDEDELGVVERWDGGADSRRDTIGVGWGKDVRLCCGVGGGRKIEICIPVVLDGV